MTFEQFITRLIFQTAWAVIRPQLPGIVTLLGFALGSYFILGLVSKFVEMVTHSVANEGKKK